uniref:Uncharacterized protein n=1 Tax=Anguilla anguilla TaxID=7936 RepID=A0A0E9PCB3_ANGAN
MHFLCNEWCRQDPFKNRFFPMLGIDLESSTLYISLTCEIIFNHHP